MNVEIGYGIPLLFEETTKMQNEFVRSALITRESSKVCINNAV